MNKERQIISSCKNVSQLNESIHTVRLGISNSAFFKIFREKDTGAGAAACLVLIVYYVSM